MFRGTFDFEAKPFDWGRGYQQPCTPLKDLVIMELPVRWVLRMRAWVWVWVSCAPLPQRPGHHGAACQVGAAHARVGVGVWGGGCGGSCTRVCRRGGCVRSCEGGGDAPSLPHDTAACPHQPTHPPAAAAAPSLQAFHSRRLQRRARGAAGGVPWTSRQGPAVQRVGRQCRWAVCLVGRVWVVCVIVCVCEVGGRGGGGGGGAPPPPPPPPTPPPPPPPPPAAATTRAPPTLPTSPSLPPYRARACVPSRAAAGVRVR